MSVAWLNYPRHFALLISAASVLWVWRPDRLAPGIGGEFALYGAVHAGALAVCVARGMRFSLSRRLLLVVGGTLLAWCSAQLGLWAVTFLYGHGAAYAGAPFLILALAASGGALAYALLIGSLSGDVPSRSRLGLIGAACAGAAALSVAACRRAHVADPLWIALPWWFAFSSGLAIDPQCRSKSIR